jgi:ferritin-like protein
MASEGLHEPLESLRPETVERHRAIVSLMEELEAIDWYDQRVDATSDPDLRRVLEHNRDEEKEHAAMTLEWIRRHDPVFDKQLREWLFTDRVIGVDAEAEGESEAASRAAGPTLGVGGFFGKGTL